MAEDVVPSLQRAPTRTQVEGDDGVGGGLAGGSGSGEEHAKKDTARTRKIFFMTPEAGMIQVKIY